MEKIKIEMMSLNDLETIKDILQTEFDEFWTYEILQQELLSNNSKYIVAKSLDNIIVGFAGIKIILDTAELMNIVTKKSFRANGIGKLMLEYLINMCKKEKIKTLNLEVNSQNTIAISLYKKYNFKEVGLRKKYYNNTYDAILMSLNF